MELLLAILVDRFEDTYRVTDMVEKPEEKMRQAIWQSLAATS